MRFCESLNLRPVSRRSVVARKKQWASLCRRQGIHLLFLHGSVAKDRQGPLGDVDLALLAPRLTYKKLLKLNASFSKILGREDVDLSWLDRASSLLGMQVLLHGVPLYVRNQKTLRQFRYRTFCNYLDSQQLRRRFADYLMQAVL